MKFIYVLVCIFFHSLLLGEEKIPKKILICGICRNVHFAASNTIKNIESLGNRFLDYQVIIYENNSKDRTRKVYQEWALKNPHVFFLFEDVPAEAIPISRTERIAGARNVILSQIKNSKYDDFQMVVIADLDFKTPWPIDEICKTIETEGDWDCVTANGVKPSGHYWDRYAFRSEQFPFGPELLGNIWWNEVIHGAKIIYDCDEWIPVYSAFGGLAIYKREGLLNAHYSGLVTKEMNDFYCSIAVKIPKNHKHLAAYCHLNKLNEFDETKDTFIFRSNTPRNSCKNYAPTCCEHVALHASMAFQGFSKIYINPKMILRY